MKESDLYLPIKRFFEENGYEGDGEVKRIDICFIKDERTVAVELKKTFDYKSIIQAALDQKLCDTVYIGIFTPKNFRSKAYKDKLYLLKRLGIGLICVSPNTGTVQVVNEPVVSELSTFQTRNKAQREQIVRELKGRKLKSNTGGVCGTKLMTAYKEEALTVLYWLGEMGGVGSGKELKAASGITKSTAIMYDNYYGWFENVSKGVYKITEEGYRALDEYTEIICKLNTEKPEDTQ